MVWGLPVNRLYYYITWEAYFIGHLYSLCPYCFDYITYAYMQLFSNAINWSNDVLWLYWRTILLILIAKYFVVNILAKLTRRLARVTFGMSSSNVYLCFQLTSLVHNIPLSCISLSVYKLRMVLLDNARDTKVSNHSIGTVFIHFLNWSALDTGKGLKLLVCST